MTTLGPDLVACLEREVPSLIVMGLSVPEHGRYDGFGLFGVERNGWVSLPHELGIVGACRGACKLARAQDAQGLADGDDRINYVVQTPQVHHFRKHAIAERELQHARLRSTEKLRLTFRRSNGVPMAEQNTRS